jgi:hypothetical protein
MREVAEKQITTQVREYSGSEAVLITDPATGRTLLHSRTRQRARPVVCSAKYTMQVGTDVEIAGAKAVADAKYAPIKAQQDADRQAALAAKAAENK